MRQQNYRQISIHGFFYPTLLFLGAGAVVIHFTEEKQIWELLHHSSWEWIALAALGQLLLLLNQSALYGAAYRLAGLPEKTGRRGGEKPSKNDARSKIFFIFARK